MISYAQNGEDVVLNRAFADQDRGFYIDIGACHPVEDSVTLHFYKRGWHGINVEPDRVLFMAFMESRPRDTNINTAVGRDRGRITFNPTGTRGHGTLDLALAAARSSGRSSDRVPMITLSDIIDCYGPDDGKVDFLKIDVEGWEAEVIASGDWSRHRPRVLVIEAVDDGGNFNFEAWEPTLLGAGYRYAMFDGLNRFYCRDEDVDELRPQLEAPANVRDDWERATDSNAHEGVARLNADLAVAIQETAAAEARAEALGADLEATRLEAVTEAGSVKQRLEVAEGRSRDLEARLATSHVDLESATARVQALEVVVARAQSEAAYALNREEAAETSMVALEAEAVRLREDLGTAARHAEQVAALEGELSKREAEGRALRDSCDQLAQQTHYLNATVSALHTSTSWKLSRPVRIFGQLLRGFRG